MTSLERRESVSIEPAGSVVLAQVRFSVSYRTVPGEEIVLVGNHPMLGAWQVEEGLPMIFSGDHWRANISLPLDYEFEYKYVVVRGTVHTWEPGRNHTLRVSTTTRVRDMWQLPESTADQLEERAVFRDAVFGRRAPKPQPAVGAMEAHVAVHFNVRAIRVAPTQSVYIVGNLPRLGNWDKQRALKLFDGTYPMWRVTLAFPKAAMRPFEYKYFIATEHQGAPRDIVWEEGDNRAFVPDDTHAEAVELNDGPFRYPSWATPLWRGAGVVVPVFSLRTRRSLGVGEFSDIKTLVDWAERVGLQGVQILPVNDTSIHMTWVDSYPYSSLSVCALHPLYIALGDIAGLPADVRAELPLWQERLEQPQLDYERTYQVKQQLLRRVFAAQRTLFEASDDGRAFVREHASWLKPYAVFCALRDRNGTANFHTWPQYSRITPDEVEQLFDELRDECMYHCFVQFHLDRQLLAASQYAREHGVFLKGDLPIGVDPLSVDVWMNPQLFRLHYQTGAPPDFFSRNGQNWGFPTYNWEEMAKDGYAWWRVRLQSMARYFQAYRIDHILGFFRIWEIPGDCITGIRGHFYPAIRLTRSELESLGLWDINRLADPYIRWHVLHELFGDAAAEVKDAFLEEGDSGVLRFRPGLHTEKLVKADVQRLGWSAERLNKLFELMSEVCLLRDDEDPHNLFHPRILLQETRSYRDLPDYAKAALYRLQHDFFNVRQDKLWEENARKKFPVMVNGTNMLVCGEDLGMIPRCVQGVLDEFNLLGLRVQRMPKDLSIPFDHPETYPWLCVATPSVHDCSTMRGWWHEDWNMTRRYYHEILHEHGEPPARLEPWIAQRIVQQHLASPAMLAMFPLQEFFAMDESLHVPDPTTEQINDPSNRHHYWRYRMHLTLEELSNHAVLTDRLKTMIAESGRKKPF